MRERKWDIDMMYLKREENRAIKENRSRIQMIMDEKIAVKREDDESLTSADNETLK